jgi:hypothetical protein
MVTYYISNKKGIIVVRKLKQRGKKWELLYPNQWKDLQTFIIRVYNEVRENYPATPVPKLALVDQPLSLDISIRVGYRHINTRVLTYDSNEMWKPLWDNIDAFVNEIKSIRIRLNRIELENKILELERTVKDLQEKLASLTLIVTSHPALKPR